MDAFNIWVAISGFIVFFLILAAGIYVVNAIFLGKIFKKAGVESWIAWVPFYNNWKFLELGGYQGWIAILSIIPYAGIVTTVFMCMAAYQIGLKLRKDGVWVVLYIFLSLVWIIILAVDGSYWDDAYGKPSLTKEPVPTSRVYY
jgi:hypothetical protein